jgi:hypothetical protein
MPPTSITPNYKLLLIYNIRDTDQDQYYYYILREFVPELESMGLYMTKAWHVAYGDYPTRWLEFVTEDLTTIREIFQSERWQTLEQGLQKYITDYERKLIRYQQGFQF